ncbi:hypothetical protein OEZ85_012549 [Tetradesmus obliquus]|uniref:Uncharacterized protein n=1 Tax=Tetradesmus obliquus TaxID=3088 RepID=A0ABY8TW68_TETOB|nr:hypothetical protein OEZ85_012549 [Tetradesmus obliquus]
MMSASALRIVLCCIVVAAALGGQPAFDAADIGSSLVKQQVHLPIRRGGEWILQLPKGSHAASITDGPTSSDLFVCTLVKSAVYHVNLATNSTQLIYQDTSSDPLPINGCAFDKKHLALWASGSISGIARVIYLKPATGSSSSSSSSSSVGGGSAYTVKDVLDVQVVKGEPCRPMQPCSYLLNEIAVGEAHVFITDSFRPQLYALPRDLAAFRGQQQQPVTAVPVASLPLGPSFHCRGPCMAPWSEKANGVAVVDNTTLLLSHWGRGNMFKVALDGLRVKSVTEIQLPKVNGAKVWADGFSMDGGASTSAWLGSNFGSAVLRLDFAPDYSSATVGCVLQPAQYSVPTRTALAGGRVWVANSHYLRCVPLLMDCSSQPYEVIGVDPAVACA